VRGMSWEEAFILTALAVAAVLVIGYVLWA
jgi:hypothetical protein